MSSTTNKAENKTEAGNKKAGKLKRLKKQFNLDCIKFQRCEKN